MSKYTPKHWCRIHGHYGSHEYQLAFPEYTAEQIRMEHQTGCSLIMRGIEAKRERSRKHQPKHLASTVPEMTIAMLDLIIAQQREMQARDFDALESDWGKVV